MRPSFIVPVLVLLVIALAGAEAARAQGPTVVRTPGAQGFEVGNGNGRAVVTRVGAIFLDVRSGRVRIVDLPGGRPPFHNRCGGRTGHRISSTTIEYRGSNIRCRIWSGTARRPWQVIMRGRGISASGIVRGSLTLDAARKGAVGVFRIGDRAERRWPRDPRTYVLRRK